MKRIIPTTTTPDKPGSRAARTALSYTTRVTGFGAESTDDDRRDGHVSFVPTVDFNYPDEGDEPAPIVRDDWRDAPLLEKCSQQRFTPVPGGDVMTMPLLDKRLEVLGYALREAVERMDFTLIHQLATKALATRERIEIEQLAASTPGVSERHGEIVIVDDADAGRVRIQFAERPEMRERRLIRMAGFFFISKAVILLCAARKSRDADQRARHARLRRG